MPIRDSALAKLLARILSDKPTKPTKTIVSEKEKEENKENNKDV